MRRFSLRLQAGLLAVLLPGLLPLPLPGQAGKKPSPPKQEERQAERPPPLRPAHVVLLNGRIWTLEAYVPPPPEEPAEKADKAPKVEPLLTEDGMWIAEAVALRGNRIIGVGSTEEIQRMVRKGYTRVINLRGRLALPGFIDNHTHFAQAGRLLLGLNLLEVNEPVEFRRRVREASERLPEGAWLVGGDWGAYAQWGQGSSGTDSGTESTVGAPSEFLPTKDLIDSVTGARPALIRRFDGELFLANSAALRAAGIDAGTPDPEGGAILRDADGEPTGLLRGSAGSLVEDVIPPPAPEQRRAEALRALDEARRFGVTSIHDNVGDFETLELYRSLQKSEELTVRVWARTWLSAWPTVQEIIRVFRFPPANGGWGDQFVRLGGLKGWVDGIMGNSTALFFEPYDHQPDNRGRLRDIMFPEGNLYNLIEGADKAGFTVTVHAIGDRANRILLDTYEKVIKANPERDRRFRVVHAQVVHPDDFERFGKLKLIAEVQPYHAIDDMRWMEERIGERARTAYAFRTLQEAGAVLSFGSDWPGTNASYYPINPLLGIYAAVTRQTLKGEPVTGWFPEQRVSMEDAVRAYTLNNAYAAFEETLKGSVKVGKIADLVVLDRDIFARPPKELLETRVDFTLFGGKIIYDRVAEAREARKAAAEKAKADADKAKADADKAAAPPPDQN